jgi:hypothetical protein
MGLEPIASHEDEIQYKALHTGALIAFVLGLLSVCVVLTAANSLEYTMMVVPIPVVGMFFALRSLSRIRQNPEQYTGLGLAKAGLALSTVFLAAGLAYGGYVYQTELPDGYTRLSFNDMKPNEIQERGNVPIPPEILALHGKKVFIKGYIRPGSSPMRTNIDRFLLVRDNNTCCFGDMSKVKYYDQMDVEITKGNRVDDNLSLLRMGGILEVHPENLAMGTSVFSLKADYAVQ